MTTDPTTGYTYSYDSQSEMITASGPDASTKTYDPFMRIWQNAAGPSASRFGYDGLYPVTNNDPNGILWTRSVYGSQSGELVVRYRDQNAATRRFVAEDERGSALATSDDSGNLVAITAYDEYGRSQTGTGAATGIVRYAGEDASGNLYDYKTRVYAPQLGIFAQPDPIRYSGDGPNLYAYVLDDPINFVDPLGLNIVVTGTLGPCAGVWEHNESGVGWTCFESGPGSPGQAYTPPPAGGCLGDCATIVVAAPRPKPKLVQRIVQWYSKPIRPRGSRNSCRIDRSRSTNSRHEAVCDGGKFNRQFVGKAPPWRN